MGPGPFPGRGVEEISRFESGVMTVAAAGQGGTNSSASPAFAAVGRSEAAPRRAVPPILPDRATPRRTWGSAGPRLLSWAAADCGVRPRDGRHDHSQLGDF